MEPILTPTNSPVSEAVVDQLARTKGWTRFMSVLLWIGGVFLVIGGIIIMGVGAFAGAAGEAMSEQFAAVGGGIAMGVIYLLMALIYIYPALKLGKYSSRINDLINQPSETNLVAALNEQRAFWKYVGIWMIVFIALYIVIIIGAVAFGAMGAMSAAGGAG